MMAFLYYGAKEFWVLTMNPSRVPILQIHVTALRLPSLDTEGCAKEHIRRKQMQIPALVEQYR